MYTTAATTSKNKIVATHKPQSSPRHKIKQKKTKKYKKKYILNKIFAFA